MNAAEAAPASPQGGVQLVDALMLLMEGRDHGVGELLGTIRRLVVEVVEPVSCAWLVPVPRTGPQTDPTLTVLRVPLFSGFDDAIATLSVAGVDQRSLRSLGRRIDTVYWSSSSGSPADLDPPDDVVRTGADHFIRGLAQALALRDRLHLALGVLMELHHCSAADAYTMLAHLAVDSGRPMSYTAADAITTLGGAR